MDTVEFLPEIFNVPIIGSRDSAITASINLTQAIIKPQFADAFDIQSAETEALKKLSEIFNTIAQCKSNPPITTALKPQPIQIPLSSIHFQPAFTLYNHCYPTHNKVSSSVGNLCTTRLACALPLQKELHTLSVLDKLTGKELEFRHLIANPNKKLSWIHSFANKLGRLAQGIGD